MPKKDEDLLYTSIKQYEEARDADDRERTWIDTDTKFAIDYEGCQWPKKLRTQREEENPPRPCIVNNKIPEKIDQVDGEFRQLRPSVKVRPVDSKADPKIAEIYGGIIRHIEYNSNARSAYNTSHTSVLYGGRGAWRIDLEDDEYDPFIRNIVINRIPNILTVVFDQYCKKQDRSDGRRLWITEDLPDAVFEAKYPGVPIIPWNSDEKTWNAWRHEKTVTVAEYWWKEKVNREYVQIEDYTGQVYTEAIDKFKETGKSEKDPYTLNNLDRLEQDGKIIDRKTVKEDKIKWALMTAGEIIKDEGTKKKINDWPGKYIPIILQFGKEVWVEGQAKTRGMVRFGRGPQEIYNFFTTKNVEVNALEPIPPWILTPNMIVKHLATWHTMHVKAFPFLYYDPDPASPTSKPEKNDPPQMSTAIAQILNQMEHDIMSGMGIYQDTLGDESTQKSGKAILAKQRQGNIGSYTFTDNFGVSYIFSSKVIIDLIPYVIDTERLMRIRGEDDTESQVPVNALPGQPIMGQFSDENGNITKKDEKRFGMPRQGVTEFINDLTVGTYDIVATIGPSYTTQREESTAILMDLLSAVPQIGEVGADLLIQNIDMKEAQQLADRIRKAMPPGIVEKDDDDEQEITEQMVQQAVQQAIQEFMQSAEGQKLQAEVTKAQASAEVASKGVEIENARLAQQQQQTQQYRLKVEGEDAKVEAQELKVDIEEFKKTTAEIIAGMKISIERTKAGSEEDKKQATYNSLRIKGMSEKEAAKEVGARE